MRTYPLKDEDVVPVEWTHRVDNCVVHGTREMVARPLVTSTDEPYQPYRCVRCMREESTLRQPFKSLDAAQAAGFAPAVPSKPTNSKDQAATDRAQLLPPLPALIEEGLALFEGVLKYGAHNYTIKGVRASVYAFATARHLAKWYFGQNRDTDTNVHHLGNARACLGVLLDAEHRGKLEDDRPPALPDIDALFAHATTVMRGLIALYGGVNPRHYTIADTEPKG